MTDLDLDTIPRLEIGITVPMKAEEVIGIDDIPMTGTEDILIIGVEDTPMTEVEDTLMIGVTSAEKVTITKMRGENLLIGTKEEILVERDLEKIDNSPDLNLPPT